jgi:hypothetical protein
LPAKRTKTKASRPKKLTTGEKTTVLNAARKGFSFVGKTLDAGHRTEIVQQAESVKGERFGKESIALWAARINFAIASGDKADVRELTSVFEGPEAKRNYMNGNCGCP